MSEKSIIFSGEMVLAILGNRKTQTRRVPTCANTYVDGMRVSKATWDAYGFNFNSAWVDQGPSPAGNFGPYLHVPSTNGSRHRLYPIWAVGDHLWVREGFRLGSHFDPGAITSGVKFGRSTIPKGYMPDGSPPIVQYRADEQYNRDRPDIWSPGMWRPSIHMPRWASRITLEITGVRVERVQDISGGDAIAEGVNWEKCPNIQTPAQIAEMIAGRACRTTIDYIGGFHCLWDSINAKRGFGWDVNPWVWVLKFKRLTS